MTAAVESTDRAVSGGGESVGAIFDSHRFAVRTASKQGNSICIPIPPAFMRAMNLFPSDKVELIFDREWGGFFVRLLKPREFRPPTPPPARTSEGTEP